MKRTLYSFGVIILFISIFLQIVFLSSLNKNYYHQMHGKLDIYQTIDRKPSDIQKAMDDLIDYIQKEDHPLDNTFFNQKERDHMVDVKDLYQSAKKFQYGGFIIGSITLVWIFIADRKNNPLQKLAIASQDALHVLGIFLVFLIAWFLIDFNFFWHTFHQLFFTNDLWLLDPTTDIMIQMLPAPVFEGLIIKIAIRSLFIFTLIWFVTRKKLSRN